MFVMIESRGANTRPMEETELCLDSKQMCNDEPNFDLHFSTSGTFASPQILHRPKPMISDGIPCKDHARVSDLWDGCPYPFPK